MDVNTLIKNTDILIMQRKLIYTNFTYNIRTNIVKIYIGMLIYYCKNVFGVSLHIFFGLNIFIHKTM